MINSKSPPPPPYLEAISITFSKIYNTWGLSDELTEVHLILLRLAEFSLSHNLAILRGSGMDLSILIRLKKKGRFKTEYFK